MSILMIRAIAKPEHTDDIDEAVRRMFVAVEEAQLNGIRYASYRLADGVTYVAELELADGIENPLPAIPEFRAFQAGLGQWLAEPPAVEQYEVLGSYSS